MSILDSIHHGDRVTITNRFNQHRTGRAVMRGPYGWVLNMGGAHGTPAIADNENIIKVSKAKYAGSNPSRDRILYERGWNVVVKQDDRYLVLRHTSTHAVTDSAYPNLSLAKARVDYLFKTHGDKPFNDLNPRKKRRKNPRGKRGGFKRLERKLARRKGVRSPRRLAAWIEHKLGRINPKREKAASRRRKSRKSRRRSR